METIKNFVIGISVISLAFVIILLLFIAWPFVVGVSSFVFFLLAAILFVIAIFYLRVLVGHITRMILSTLRKDSAPSSQGESLPAA